LLKKYIVKEKRVSQWEVPFISLKDYLLFLTYLVKANIYNSKEAKRQPISKVKLSFAVLAKSINTVPNINKCKGFKFL
jgi:hypothetical protein